MRRRDFITLLGSGAVAWPLAARAQQPAMPVVGYLRSSSFDGAQHMVAGFRQGLKEAGYIEGQNVAIELRSADEHLDRLPALVTDFIRRPVAVIVGNTPAALAAKAATTTVPIVFVTGADPVRVGLVASLNRPGGNVTGMSFRVVATGTKLLELLRQVAPNATTIAMLVNPSSPDIIAQWREVQAAALATGLKVQVLNANTTREIYAVFETVGSERPDALFVAASPFLNGRSVQLAQLAAFHRLPSAYSLREAAEVGGLMSYGANVVDAFRQAGAHVGRILKGAKPADLPVMQSTKIELVINLQTARAFDLEIPPTLLARADEVIE
jgi:putative ABC transport system substrate-binding protein